MFDLTLSATNKDDVWFEGVKKGWSCMTWSGMPWSNPRLKLSNTSLYSGRSPAFFKADLQTSIFISQDTFMGQFGGYVTIFEGARDCIFEGIWTLGMKVSSGSKLRGNSLNSSTQQPASLWLLVSAVRWWIVCISLTCLQIMIRYFQEDLQMLNVLKLSREVLTWWEWWFWLSPPLSSQQKGGQTTQGDLDSLIGCLCYTLLYLHQHHL